MNIIKLTWSDEEVERLREEAGAEGMTMQEFIKWKTLGVKNVLSPAEAVKRALDKKAGETFSVPELFSESEYTIKRGYAGVLGRDFKALVDDNYSRQIRFAGYKNGGRHAMYERIGPDTIGD